MRMWQERKPVCITPTCTVILSLGPQLLLCSRRAGWRLYTGRRKEWDLKHVLYHGSHTRDLHLWARQEPGLQLVKRPHTSPATDKTSSPCIFCQGLHNMIMETIVGASPALQNTCFALSKKYVSEKHILFSYYVSPNQRSVPKLQEHENLWLKKH